MKVNKQIRPSKRGAALVEYGLIVAGVALVAAAAVSIFGSKTAGLVAASAKVLPGANPDDNTTIEVGHIVSVNQDGGIDESKLDEELATKLGIEGTELVKDPENQ
jgi:Flp pilus assembly pilin Flp